MLYVYILYSPKIDRFYIGQTFDVDARIEKHNSGFYDNKWTARGKPWKLFLKIETTNKETSLKIEAHIKKMKNKKYIRNLAKYPEMAQKLIDRFSTDC